MSVTRCFQAKDIRRVCRDVEISLGYQTLKEEQLAVMVRFVRGEDVLAVLPTGFGKSLRYACLPGVFDSLGYSGTVVVVVTPLNIYYKDQVSVNYYTFWTDAMPRF